MPTLTDQEIDQVYDQAKIQAILNFYEDVLKPKYEPTRMGDYIILDPLTLDYEVDATPKAARSRLQVRHPDMLFVTLQVGYPVIPYRSPVVELGRSSS